MGLLANFMVYLIKIYHMNQVSATSLMGLWTGVTNFLPLLGAFLSDAYIGRYWTIAIASVFSFLVITANLTHNSFKTVFFESKMIFAPHFKIWSFWPLFYVTFQAILYQVVSKFLLFLFLRVHATNFYCLLLLSFVSNLCRRARKSNPKFDFDNFTWIWPKKKRRANF